jgi:hypothetical protein
MHWASLAGDGENKIVSGFLKKALLFFARGRWLLLVRSVPPGYF